MHVKYFAWIFEDDTALYNLFGKAKSIDNGMVHYIQDVDRVT